ncbi:MAG: recombination regulator RecX [Gemmatimonadota bacterium]|jgi:regulatory protein|nr:recombination regulator RecX [Gemmatimonadota bacterium]
MEITAIRKQKNRSNQVMVCLDGDHQVVLSTEVVTRSGLRRGISIAEDQLASLVSEDREIRAREAALRLLERRAQSRVGVRRSLARKGFEPEVVEACITRLDNAGLLDDRSYAVQFVTERSRSRPRGVMGLEAELIARGIDADTAEAAITEVLAATGASELDLAAIAARKFRRRAGEAPLATRRRLQGFLARRGFSAETVRSFLSLRAAGGPASA